MLKIILFFLQICWIRRSVSVTGHEFEIKLERVPTKEQLYKEKVDLFQLGVCNEMKESKVQRHLY